MDVPLDLALDGRNVVSVNRRWAPDAHHRPGTIAFTVVTTDAPSGAFLEGDVELNARSPDNPLGRGYGDGPPVWGDVDAPTVLLHELGHVAGLGHSLEAGAVMEASMDVERQRRALTDDDRRGLCAARTAAPPPAEGGGCSAAGGLARGRASVLSLLLAGLAARRRRSRDNPGGHGMTLSRWWQSLALVGALFASNVGCGDDEVANTGRATSRVIRGRVPVRVGAFRVLRVTAVNALTRRVVSSAGPRWRRSSGPRSCPRAESTVSARALSEMATSGTGHRTIVPTSQRPGGVAGAVARQYADAVAGGASAERSRSARPAGVTARRAPCGRAGRGAPRRGRRRCAACGRRSTRTRARGRRRAPRRRAPGSRGRSPGRPWWGRRS